LLCLGLFQIAREGIELRLPKAPVFLDPSRRRFEWPAVELAAAQPALLLALDQPGRLQDVQVLGDRRQRHLEGLGQLPHRDLAQRQACQDRAPGWIGQRAENLVQ